MSTAVMTHRLEFQSVADGALKRAGQSWFVVAMIGQFVFAFTVASFYGLSAIRGDFDAWNRALFQGYVAGQTMGNAALLGHILFATVVSTAGALQFVPRLRSRFPVFHRWNGRIFILTAFVMSLSGLYLTFGPGRKAPGDIPQHIASFMGAALIMTCATFALRTALAHDFRTHRRWALRLFIVASGSWFFRIGFLLSILLNGGPFGFDQTTFRGPLLTFWAFAQYLLPLAALELYLRAQDHSGALRRMATAAVVFVLTLATAAGIFAASMAIWVPTVKAAYDTRKSIRATLSGTIASGGIDEGVKQYRELKAAQPTVYNFDEGELNNLGYQFMRAKQYKEAIRIFQLNIEAYPKSSNVYDSLGEAYMDDGEKELAIANYQKSLQLNPKNHNAVLMLEKLNNR
jgi:outer membrane protein assembly factor BamD (BamD/ComL family)